MISEKAGPSVIALPQQGDDDPPPVWGFAGSKESEQNAEPITGKPEERGLSRLHKKFRISNNIFVIIFQGAVWRQSHFQK